MDRGNLEARCYEQPGRLGMAVVQGKIDDARTNCSVIAYSQDNTPIARWEFTDAWPSKVVGPDMDTGSQDYMIEEVTIVHEGLERVSV